MGASRFGGAGASSACARAACWRRSRRREGRWIGLVVFGPETSVGIVQLFFDQMVEQLVSAAPREQAPAPMLAENFESELNASLKALFGR